MNAVDNIEAVLRTNNEFLLNLKYCLHINKVPYRYDGAFARPNQEGDFVSLEEIMNNHLKGKLDLYRYNGLGISCKANNLIAIDVDHCFSKELDFSSIDERGKRIYEMFKGLGYIEFSFSGTGMRILLNTSIIPENYSDTYYIKNSKNQVEFYDENSIRYVTITGNYINNDLPVKEPSKDIIKCFLDEFMLKPKSSSTSIEESVDDSSIEDLMKEVRIHLISDPSFQHNWYTKAPGFNSNESERDYFLIAYIINHITTDRNKVREIIEKSPFYNSKDKAHINKWKRNNYYYYNFQFDGALANGIKEVEE